MILLRLYFTLTVIRAPQMCACLLVSCPFFVEAGGGGWIGRALTFLPPSPAERDDVHT